MSKLGFVAQASMERETHPLDLNGVRRIASSMAHDGDYAGALELVEDTLGRKDDVPSPACGMRDSTSFHQLLGMRSILYAIVGRERERRSTRRAASAARAVRRSVRSVP